MAARPLADRALRLLLAFAFVILCAWQNTAHAQVPDEIIGPYNWWRGCASLDLDFYNDQYYINHNTTCDGTIGTTYVAGSGNTGVQNFIAGTGATFTRAGTTNVTTTSPPSTSPFFLPSADTFVSRADSTAIATYFNSSGVLTTVASAGAGRTAAYTYNGSSWVNGGTLAEPAATNLIAYSSGTTGEAQGGGGTTTYTTSSVLSPDNSTYFLLCKEGTGDECRWTVAMNGFTTYTVSAYVKAAGTPYFLLLADDSKTYSSATVNLSTGTSTMCGTGAGGSTGIQSIGGGVYRIWLTFTTTIATPSGAYIDFRLQNSAPPFSGCATGVAGDGSSGVDIWGVQLEQSSYPTSYIATSGSTKTRAADVYSVPNGGTYFDTTGTMQQAAASAPRLDHSPTSPYSAEGVLIEESRTNSVPNNMMAGAVVADGIERTTGGTFGGCSGSTCTGWTTTVNGGTGSVSYTSGNATLTGDGTNAASIYQAIPTIAGYSYTIAVTTGSGNAVTVQAGTTAGAVDRLAASSVAASTTTRYSFTAGGTTTYVQINNASATAANVTAVSVQSAGKSPTGWGGLGTVSGITSKITGTGVEFGMPYVEENFSGTNSSGAVAYPGLQTTGTLATSSSVAWSGSVYARLVGGTLPQQFQNYTFEYNSSQTYLGGGSTAVTSLSSTVPQRVTLTSTVGSSTAYIAQVFKVSRPNATTGNVTIRFYAPQLELGAFPTSVIPTYGSAVTRAADKFTLPTTAGGGSGWYNASAAQGTLGAVGVMPFTDSGTHRLAMIDDGTQNNSVMFTFSNMINYLILINGGTQTDPVGCCSSVYTANTTTQGVIAYQSDVNGALDGTGYTHHTGISVPTMTELDIGSQPSAYYLDGWINRIWYMPIRTPDAALPELAP